MAKEQRRAKRAHWVIRHDSRYLAVFEPSKFRFVSFNWRSCFFSFDSLTLCRVTLVLLRFPTSVLAFGLFLFNFLSGDILCAFVKHGFIRRLR